MVVFDAAAVRGVLTYDICIPAIRDAMMRLSAGETRQMLRSIVPLAEGNMFGVMAGALGGEALFGSKLVSVYPAALTGASHQGVVVLFEPRKGRPVCVADAGAITSIRTAAASAVATDALARADADHLAILGYGEQAPAHARAIAKVRALRSISIWGRCADRAERLAHDLSEELGLPARAFPTAREAVAGAGIICTLTSSPTPILEGRWVEPGCHVNLVGSSYAGPVEVDHELVAMSRFIADSREGVAAQGAEFLAARAAGLIGDDHIAGEIGEILLGDIEGRQSPTQVTAYKSLGHIVQDISAAAAVLDRCSRQRTGAAE